MPVLLEEAPRPIAKICDLIIDPANGGLIAFSVDPAGKKIISPRDVVRFSRYLMIHDSDDICEPDEVLRVKEVRRSGIKFIKNRVETESGEYLGRVFDFSMNVKLGAVTKLHVAKSLLGLFRIDTRIISIKYVLDVTADKIVVKDTLAKIPIEELHEEVLMEEELLGA